MIRHARSTLPFAAVTLALFAGCANVVGVDFVHYHEAIKREGEQLVCIPNQTSRCTCDLDEGLQSCDADGRLGPCQCNRGDAGAEAATGAAVCGNGVVETGEACDDGNATSGDGCSAECAPDGRPREIEACPGQPVAVWPGVPARFTFAGAARGSHSDAGTCGTMAEPDRVYAVRASKAGTIEIKIMASEPLFFSLRTQCGSASIVVCAFAPANTPTTRSITVNADQPVYLSTEPLAPSTSASTTVELRL